MSNLFPESATVQALYEKMKFENLTPDIDLNARKLDSFSVNRPAFPLTGFFEGFEGERSNRIQLIGQAEQVYLQTLTKRERHDRFERLAEMNIPCFIFTRGYHPCEGILEACLANNVPIFVTDRSSGDTISEITRWLRVVLAPKQTIHGVLIDVYGEGVLIMGDSGIGKSEAALELVKRGHRLVSDDVVEIRKVSDVTLVGMSPDITKDFIELRGIGIINIRSMFGFEAVKQTQNIDMVINLSVFDESKQYDRIGAEQAYMEILGNKVIKYDIPISPGRNIAIITECAAVNNRARKMGYNAPEEFMNRINAGLLDQSKAFSAKN